MKAKNKYKKAKEYEPLNYKKLKWECPPDFLPAKTTEEIEISKNIIGQERAINAIKIGLEMKHVGYNIYVSGLTGTGKMTTIKKQLEELEKGIYETPPDLCYVNNFENPDAPILLTLPAGKGKEFKNDMENLIETLKINIPGIFQSEEYKKKQKDINIKYQKQINGLLEELKDLIEKNNFTLVPVQVGPFSRPTIFPLKDGKPIYWEQFNQLVEEGKISIQEKEKTEKKYEEINEIMQDTFAKISEIERKAQEDLLNYDKVSVNAIISVYFDRIKNKYNNLKIDNYLDDVKNDILSNLDIFREKEEKKKQPGILPAPPSDKFQSYYVNLLVDNSKIKGPPIIILNSPTFKNVFGTIDRYVDKNGVWKSDFTNIKAGAIVKANGGFLVMNVTDVLMEPGVYQALKRVLRTQSIQIQPYDPFFFFTPTTLQPEEICITTKVILIGDAYLYYILYELDEDFKKIFKIKADFDTTMDLNKQNIKEYTSFISMLVKNDNLLPFDESGLSEMVEYGVRYGGRQNKISTRFSFIADVVREASYWASKEKSPYVKDKHVKKAIEEKILRVNLIEKKIDEMIENGTIFIDTEGSVVGQVNGLSIIDLGDYFFGRPTRITARTSLGKAGVINIEREAELSGKIHNKGVQILSGFLRGQFAQSYSLPISASICFEQSYSGVDGDSASSTELYAIISSLSDIPIRQDIAVTGSVNQKGEIQPIGGINEKIEGFFYTCKIKGLTGKQGVIIPKANVPDLMLNDDVVNAVKEGKFFIYPISCIDEGIEILTGVKAGKLDSNGNWEPGTVYYYVDKKLKQYINAEKKFEKAKKQKRKVKKQKVK